MEAEDSEERAEAAEQALQKARARARAGASSGAATGLRTVRNQHQQFNTSRLVKSKNESIFQVSS